MKILSAEISPEEFSKVVEEAKARQDNNVKQGLRAHGLGNYATHICGRLGEACFRKIAQELDWLILNEATVVTDRPYSNPDFMVAPRSGNPMFGDATAVRSGTEHPFGIKTADLQYTLLAKGAYYPVRHFEDEKVVCWMQRYHLRGCTLVGWNYGSDIRACRKVVKFADQTYKIPVKKFRTVEALLEMMKDECD